MSGTYLLLDDGGTVTNVILWDGIAPYAPGPGLTLLAQPAGVDMGWTRATDGSWSPPADS